MADTPMPQPSTQAMGQWKANMARLTRSDSAYRPLMRSSSTLAVAFQPAPARPSPRASRMPRSTSPPIVDGRNRLANMPRKYRVILRRIDTVMPRPSAIQAQRTPHST